MTTIDDHDQYTIARVGDAVLLAWKETPGLSADDFASGITRFATHCEQGKPTRAVIDARRLDQTSQATSWLRNQETVDGLDPYQTWWEREIDPRYNAAGIDSMAVATGDPNAPGQIPSPTSAHFAVAYLSDLDAARTWQPSIS